MMRNLFIAAAFVLTTGSAHAGDFKVTGKPVAAASSQHLASHVQKLEWGIMADKDEHFDPHHAGSTPQLAVVPHSGKLQQVRAFDEHDQYNVNHSPAFKVSELGPDNVLHTTALLPVSGHVGNGPARVPGKKIGTWDITSNKNETAAQYAASNRYNIEVKHLESGKTQRFAGIPSTGLVTAHELDIDMSNKGTYRVQFWPDGSGGVGGYAAGRTVDLVKE